MWYLQQVLSCIVYHLMLTSALSCLFVLQLAVQVRLGCSLVSQDLFAGWRIVVWLIPFFAEKRKTNTTTIRDQSIHFLQFTCMFLPFNDEIKLSYINFWLNHVKTGVAIKNSIEKRTLIYLSPSHIQFASENIIHEVCGKRPYLHSCY